MGEAVQPRKQAYLDLLHRGLVQVRNFAHSGNVELCRIEADHLHNIPSLLHEDNEYRHAYHIRGERGLYLQRLRELGVTEYLEQVGIWLLQSLAGAGRGRWPAPPGVGPRGRTRRCSRRRGMIRFS